MNLPNAAQACCDCRAKSKVNVKNRNMHFADYWGENDASCIREKEADVTHPQSKRKRQLPVYVPPTQSVLTRNRCINLVCISSILLVSFVNLGYASDISISSSNNINGESTPTSSLPFGSNYSPDSPSFPTVSSSVNSHSPILTGPVASSPTIQVGATQAPSITTQSYFINGYANQIQRTSVSELRRLAGDKRFQLQYRTVCPFGNIINDDKFALRFNSGGYLTYLLLPSEATLTKSREGVADGNWHTVTFHGPELFIDDPDSNGRYGDSIKWESETDNEPNNHTLSFFDGFVGCVRLNFPANSSFSSGTPESNQSPISTNENDNFSVSLFNGLGRYQPCNDLDFDLRTSAQCFEAETFTLCSQCEVDAKCVFTDGKNECECPFSEDETAPYTRSCRKRNESGLESRELHPALADHSDLIMASTTGSYASSLIPQSSHLPSTTEHMSASSTEQRAVVPDVCGQVDNRCGPNGRCFNDPTMPEGFECYCKPGYSGNHCDHNYDECLSNPCKNNATCADGINNYSCNCLPGYSGKNCEVDINECDSNPCQHGGHCEDLIAQYRCECVPGYTGENCETNIDECDPDPCLNDGQCIDQINAYICNCTDTGFEGTHCEKNVDDCKDDPCQNGGTCVDGIKKYTCACHPGYNGGNCENDIRECDNVTCSMHGTCYERSDAINYEPGNILDDETFNQSTAAGYVCHCARGYEGTDCEIDIDECEVAERTKRPCSGNGKCVDGVDTYTCNCNKGFTGEICETDIDECKPNPCEPEKSTDCRNLAGDYECICSDGYGGKNCSVALQGCIRNVCNNDGICTPLYDENTATHNFTCTCKPGFTGPTCSKRTTMAFNGTSIAEIVKNDEAFANNKYTLSFQFRTTLSNVILAAGRGGTYFFLVLNSGKVNLQSSLLNDLPGMSAGTNLTNGDWHKVVVSINASHTILIADKEQVTLPITLDEDLPQQGTGFDYTSLGSLISTLGFLNKQDAKPFVGCMQEVFINDERILPEDPDPDGNINLTNITSQCVRKEQCVPNPCQANGKCTDLWNRYTCDCPRPHLGNKCQYSYIPATFNHENTSNSLAIVDIPPGRFGGVFDISMFVRTRQSHGTIFLMCDKERLLNGSFIQATVGKAGNLVVQVKWANGSGDLKEEEKPETYTVDSHISDGERHLISVQRDKSFVIIKVDGAEHFRKSHSNRIFIPTVMYIGGQPAPQSEDIPAAAALTQEGHSGETSTSLPDGSFDHYTEVMDTETVMNVDINIPPEYRFKGVIQDVRINLSVSDPSPIFGHSSHAKSQKHVYIVEFFNLTAEVHEQKNPLGKVVTQNLLEGEQSDNTCADKDICFRGKCVVTWNDYVCECNPHYAGKNCDVELRCGIVTCPQRSICRNIGYDGFECVSDAAFDGKGSTTPHYRFHSSPAHNEITFNEIKFGYRSKRSGDILHMSNGPSFMKISVEAGINGNALIFYFPNNERLQVENASVLDGEWHTVGIKFAITTVENPVDSFTLNFDKNIYNSSMLRPSEAAFTHFTSEFFRNLVTSSNLQMVVGGSLSTGEGQSDTQFYRGCLKDVYIGRFRLPFVSPQKLMELKSNENVNRSILETTAPAAFYITDEYIPDELLGCTLCWNKDCQHGGQCVSPIHSYDCSCSDGYTGETCQIDIDECLENRCSHGARCVDGIHNYTCVCPRGYEGWLCDIDIDECEGNREEKCSGNGDCVDGVGEYTCNCNDDFTGPYCEKRKKANCGDQPCENDATCRDIGITSNGISFKCTCTQGWEGEFCSVPIDYCKNATCGYGECENTGVGYRCNCDPGYDGIHCEHNIDDCASSPCVNGACRDGINSFTCDCDGTGFQGTTCAEDIDECKDWGKYLVSQPCPDHLVCDNLVGTYVCSCPDKSKCGENCNIDNPCFFPNNITCQNNGTCKPLCDQPEEPSYTCSCTQGFEGQFCEMLVSLERPASGGGIDILLIIIPVLAAILIAATIGIIILVRMARRKRATRGVYSPSQQEYCNPRVELDNVMKPPPEERLI